MKKIVSIVLCLSLALSLSLTAFAAEAAPGDSRAVIGANLTDEQVNENTRRFAREDSIRNAYVATFPNEQRSPVS